MRYLILVIGILVGVGCSSNESTTGVQSRRYISNLSERNHREIEGMQAEMKAMGIEKREANRKLIERLERLHSRTVGFIDSIDSFDGKIDYRLVNEFVKGNFQIESPMNKNDAGFYLEADAPAELMKIHLAISENNYLTHAVRKQYDYPEMIRLKSFSIQIEPEKSIYKNGEKITGSISIIGSTHFSEAKRMVQKLKVNGMDVEVSDSGWKFSLIAPNGNKGIVPFALRGEAMVGDSSKLNGSQLVYIMN